jgi:hypothetical protein
MWLSVGQQQKNHLADRKCSGQFGCLYCPTTFKTERGCKQHIVEEHPEHIVEVLETGAAGEVLETGAAGEVMETGAAGEVMETGAQM